MAKKATETIVEKTYAEMTTEELRALIRERNEERDSSGLRIGKTKADLITNLEEDDVLESATGSTRFADTSGRVEVVKIEDISISPLNPRHEADYLSVSLQNSILQAGGLLSPIILYPASAVENNGSKDKYYVLGGNRRFVNYRHLVQNEDALLSVEMTCVIREYDGNPRSVRAQITSELENDNKSLAFTNIDTLRLVNARLQDGRSRASIASERGFSESYLSQLLRLNRLPQRYLDLVHYSCRLEELGERSTEELEQMNVPFVVGESGEVTILSVTYNNAQRMAATVPKISKSASVKEQNEHGELVESYHEMFLSPEFQEMASTLNENDFAAYLESSLNTLLGLSAPEDKEPTQDVEESKDVDTKTEFEKDLPKEEPKVEVDVDSSDLGTILKHDVDGFVGLLTSADEDGNYFVEIPDAWQEDAAPALVEDPELRKALLVLIDRGLIEDRRPQLASAAAE